MSTKFLTLSFLLIAACGGSPTSSDPIVTMVGDPEPVLTVDAGPDSAVISPEPTQNDAGDAGTTEKPDATPTIQNDAGTPIPAPDAGSVTPPTKDAGPLADASGPIIVNDAGAPLCCSMLPILNTSGTPIGTMPPQPCQTWGTPSGAYPVGTVVCGIAVDPTDYVCALQQAGQTSANSGWQTVCP